MIAPTREFSMPERMLQVVNNVALPVYICSQDGRIIFYNDAAEKLWGRKPGLNREYWDGAFKTYNSAGLNILPADGPVARSVRGIDAINGEELIIERPDGSRRFVSPYPVLLTDKTGQYDGVMCTLIDITEQKLGENKQAMLAAIVESSTDAIISKTLDGTITSWNRGAENLFGYKEYEAIGRNITMLIPQNRLSEETHIISQITNNKRVDHFQTIRLDKMGKELNLSITVSPIKDSKGVVIGASKIARDISEQKSSEERLQRYAKSLETLNTFGKEIAENMEVQGILQKVTDVTTQLTGAAFGAFFYNQVNEKGESYTLYTISGVDKAAFEGFAMPRNTALFSSTFKGERIVRSDDITQDALYGRNAPHQGMPKGHLPVVSYLAVPVVSKSGLVIGGLFFGHPHAAVFTADHENLVANIAGHAAIALENARLYEDIKVLNAKKDEFIGLASHELKTPVTSINGFLQIVERSLEDGDRNKTFVHKTLNQVAKLTSLITDLLDVSKIITGKLPFTYTAFDLREAMREWVEMLNQTYPSHLVQITAQSAPAPLMIKADIQRIEQVLINLVSNAVKYSPNANKVDIVISTTPQNIRVAVTDFGIGIAEEHRGRIFSRFYRVENLAAHMSGLGIGLYICNEIIARHQGRIWVESVPTHGSTFYFELPTTLYC